MGKLYTIDGKYLTDAPEIRIGGKIYAVDDRKKTVESIIRASKSEIDDFAKMDKILKLALGESAYKELEAMNISFPAYRKLLETVMAAVTGEEPEASEARFQEAKSANQ